MSAKKIFVFLILSWNIFISAQSEGLRIIYIIHGDGNYLFHDEEGNAMNAAEIIIEQSKYVAENINKGEVFIFYQKPAANFLFFAKDDGEFYYYQNGVKVSEESYSRKNAVDFEIEAGLIRKYSESSTEEMKNIFLYYGHEIPLQKSFGYHSSYSEKEFDINIFSDGVKNLISTLNSSEDKFDLIVLSTCRNGNRETISALSTFTNYLLASPGDIHLSYLNSESLISLSKKKSLDIYYLAKQFAQSAFEKLSGETSTEIHINVYNLRNISEKEEPAITEFYRAPKFGRKNSSLK